MSSTRSSTRSGQAETRGASRSMAKLRSSRTRLLLLAGLALFSVTRAAQYEPPGNQVLFGAWIDTAAGYSDTPAGFNARLGQNVPVYQLAQDIPLIPFNFVTGAGGPAPERLIELSLTDAAVFLTIYPANGFAAVTPADIAQLGAQILDYQVNLNRTVFLRYAPEMQGLWNSQYGQRPTAFVASWRAMYTAIKAIAPLTILVWAPNTSQGYPYGQTLTANTAAGFPASSAADRLLLDTNRNGVLDPGDDAFAPYYPGDDFVDWIGISIYYKGPNGRDVNVVQTPGYCSDAINGIDPDTKGPITNFYTTYCTNKPTKACMFAESGAAFHVDVPGGVTSTALHQGWVLDCLTNVPFLDRHPRLKLLMQFEYEKVEASNDGSPDLRDFRLTNDTAVLAVFREDFVSIGPRFSWANSRAAPTSISTPGAPSATPINTDSNGAIITTFTSTRNSITATTRARPTGFPALFGTTSDGRSMAEIIEVLVMVTCGVVGSLAVMKMM